MNEALVWVRHPGSPASSCKVAIDCVVGTHLRIDPCRIRDFSCKLLEDVEQDLVLIAGAVAFADRRSRRRRSTGWQRRIHLTVPVSNPFLWSSERIRDALRGVLGCVSGDLWEFEFASGFKPLVEKQSSLDFEKVSDVVIPFSDGLDSFAQWCSLSRESCPKAPLRVHSCLGHEAPWRHLPNSGNHFGTGARLNIPIKLRVGNHPEPSYRTRAFLFYTLAALAAAKLGLCRVVIGENGISTLGPPLLPYAAEHPCLGTHPNFTTRLAVLLNVLLGTNIVFEHPQLFTTKGAMLRQLGNVSGDSVLHTKSCVRDSRARLGAKHCGICCGCLLRRVALHAVGKRDKLYTWDDLSGSTLADCRSPSASRSETENNEDIARHGIHLMESVAQLGRLEPDHIEIRKCAKELSSCGAFGCSDRATEIAALFSVYRDEWVAFKDQFGSGSLLRRYERN